MTEPLLNEINFSNSGMYQILVKGKVSPEIWEYFEGQTVRISECEGGQIYTSLKVHVRDQVELSGLINLLHGWQLVLLSFEMEGHIKKNAL